MYNRWMQRNKILEGSKMYAIFQKIITFAILLAVFVCLPFVQGPTMILAPYGLGASIQFWTKLMEASPEEKKVLLSDVECGMKSCPDTHEVR